MRNCDWASSRIERNEIHQEASQAPEKHELGFSTTLHSGHDAVPVSTHSHLYFKWDWMSEATAPSPGPLPQCVLEALTEPSSTSHCFWVFL